MKLNKISKSLGFPLSLIGILFASTSLQAGTMGPIVEPGGVYIGAFGGAGASTKTDMHQYGTAFFTEAEGGPLAVNAFGRSNHRTVGLVGGHVGYEWSNSALNMFSLSWNFSPAVEMEGYYLGHSSFKGHDINNETVRLPEHDFVVNYPMSTGVFLVNALANFNPSAYERWHPYVGAGIGGAIVSISHATAIQVSPPEVGVNHFNSNPNSTSPSFAIQVKPGLSFDINPRVGVFAEYRWLYLTNTSHIFGSTAYPGHAATSSWLTQLGPQYYNMGAIGINVNI